MIRISEGLLGDVRAHGERDYPRECCGALLGTELVAAGESVKTVIALHPADNRRDAEAAARRFLIAPDDYREIERSARARALDIVGFYHSHPDHPAQPSEFDREHALPWFSYLIVSVREGRAGEISSWTLADDRSVFAPEPMAKTDTIPGHADTRTNRSR